MNRFFEYTKRNIRRTPYQALAASMIMFLTFLALSVFLILGIGSQKILKYFEQKPQVIAFFKENTTDADVAAISNALRQTGKVHNLEYRSKEDALKLYQERNKNDPKMLELVTASYLPTSLEISANSPTDLPLIAEIIEKEPVVDDVLFPKDVIERVTQTTTLIRVIGSVVVGFLMLFSALIITMIIGFKIRIKRDEIEIMKLLGASTWFIRMPFILEGIAYATIGSFLAFILSYGSIWYFEPLLIQSLGDVGSQIFPVSWIFVLVMFLVNILVAILIGSVSSFNAVRRYLRS